MRRRLAFCFRCSLILGIRSSMFTIFLGHDPGSLPVHLIQMKQLLKVCLFQNKRHTMDAVCRLLTVYHMNSFSQNLNQRFSPMISTSVCISISYFSRIVFFTWSMRSSTSFADAPPALTMKFPCISDIFAPPI